jgi:hypothetical protein
MKATVFYKSEFLGDIKSIEVTVVEHGTRQYAQYTHAPFVKFKKKGGRNLFGIQQTYKPFLCIVAGWNLDIKPDDAYETVSTTDKMTIRKSKYSSFDDRYVSDFEQLLLEKGIQPIALYK